MSATYLAIARDSGKFKFSRNDYSDMMIMTMMMTITASMADLNSVRKDLASSSHKGLCSLSVGPNPNLMQGKLQVNILHKLLLGTCSGNEKKDRWL